MDKVKGSVERDFKRAVAEHRTLNNVVPIAETRRSNTMHERECVFMRCSGPSRRYLHH